ncbi:MAG: EamA family transporter [Actinobacteria bacterium]|nr:MAG: EamA family transporter [Actinomycetota bacterium]
MSKPAPHSASASARIGALPPELFFICSATAQYIGAVIAFNLFDQLAPASVAWLRVISAALILLAFSARRLRAQGKWTTNELVSAATFGIAVAFMNLTFYLAIDRLDLGKGVAIEFIGPICVAALQTKSRRNAGALGLATLGVVILSGFELGNEPLGLLFIFLASACWAAYIVIGSRVAQLNRGVSGLGVGLVIGAVVIAPFGAPQSGPAWGSPSILGLCLLVGLFSNALGYGIEQSIMRKIPVRRFSVLLALLPVTAVVFGFFFLNQTPTFVDLIGIAFVLTGVIVQQRDTLTPTSESA